MKPDIENSHRGVDSRLEVNTFKRRRKELGSDDDKVSKIEMTLSGGTTGEKTLSPSQEIETEESDDLNSEGKKNEVLGEAKVLG
jgi:hypothetical protein